MHGNGDGVTLEYFPAFYHCGDWSASPLYGADVRVNVTLEEGILSTSVAGFDSSAEIPSRADFSQAAVVAWRICPATVFKPAPFQGKPTETEQTPPPADSRSAPPLSDGEIVLVVLVTLGVVAAVVGFAVVWRRRSSAPAAKTSDPTPAPAPQAVMLETGDESSV